MTEKVAQMSQVAVVFHGFDPDEVNSHFQEAANALTGKEGAHYALDPLSLPTIFTDCNVDTFGQVSCGDHVIDAQRKLGRMFSDAGNNVTVIADRNLLHSAWSHTDQTEFGQIHVLKLK
jgi:hypothetical protein